MRRLAAPAAVALLLLASPLAAGQAADPVEACARQCAPQDEDVNGGRVATGAEPTTTILYAHFMDILNRAPLNTQPPGPDEEQIERGFLLPSLGSDAGPPQTHMGFDNNWFHMFSSSGLVEIVDGQWRTHQEPGLAAPVVFAGDRINLYFYLSAHPVPGQGSDTSPAGAYAVDVMPGLAVYARLETGRHAFGEDSLLIAEGDTGRGDWGPVPTGAGRATLVTLPGHGPVYEFQVPLWILEPSIPSVWDGAQGFLLTVHPYQVRGNGITAAEGVHATQADWRVHAGPATPPRLVFDMHRPLLHKASDLTMRMGLPAYTWSVASPFGAYDVDADTFTLRAKSPDGDTLTEPARGVRYDVSCGGSFKPVTAAWWFDGDRDDLPDGVYELTASVMNRQHTYELIHTERILLQGDTVTPL